MVNVHSILCLKATFKDTFWNYLDEMMNIRKHFPRHLCEIMKINHFSVL